MKQLQNPLLKGFYPDPSICRVGEDFYMVTSSFSYFPGVPVFHSRDLCSWEQIGHVLDRPEQLPLNGKAISGGIFAPTIRYHEGTFYMITTNIDHGGNFIVTAENPAGPWSNPHWIEHAPGIDPSLFWDEDGRAYMSGTAGFGAGEAPIWICEIDLQEFKLIGERKHVWGGALIGASAPEAPHIYKKDGWYYLLIAEGGTEHFHAVTIARSKEIYGPYEGNPGNPIMTHRHLGEQYPICNTGHADFVELADGSWYAVMLASRIYGGYHKNLGRETFIAPMIWEQDWPIISPGSGRIEWTYPAPKLTAGEVVPQSDVTKDEFDSSDLPFYWNSLGTPTEAEEFKVSDSHLYIRTGKQSLIPIESSGKKLEMGFGKREGTVLCMPFMGRRQQHMSFEAATKLDFLPEGTESAGIAVLQNNFHSLRLEVRKQEGTIQAVVVKATCRIEGNRFEGTAVSYWEEEVLGEQVLSERGSYELVIRAEGQAHQFLVRDGESLYVLAENVDGGFLGSETAGGFVGAYIGMFASGNGTDTGRRAGFDWFMYTGK